MHLPDSHHGFMVEIQRMHVIVPKIILASVRIVCSKVCIQLQGRSTGNLCFCKKLIYSNLIDLF
jgi:hypothetical protein